MLFSPGLLALILEAKQMPTTLCNADLFSPMSSVTCAYVHRELSHETSALQYKMHFL